MDFKLILKKLNNTLSEEESAIFSKWYNDSNQHKDFFEKVKQAQQDEALLVDIEKGWKSIENKIKPVSAKKTNYLKYAVAASIVLLVSITIIVQQNTEHKVVAPEVATKNIKIGTDKATLTLADGTNVTLEKGQHYISNNIESNGEELVYQPSKNQNPEIAYNYLAIPRGGQYHVVLSDGTEVWLNSESKLKYPEGFIKGEPRAVELVYGEAYFDVSPSSNHEGAKFKVITNDQEIEVLGTEFNIKAYRDENLIYSTLVEGKILIKSDSYENILLPNQQTIINKNNNAVDLINVDDLYSITSWRKGVFSFKDMPLSNIMKVLSRWYDAEVIFANKEAEDILFTGILDKNQSIEEILFSIYNTNNITYEINDKTIIFK
ncbi:FecR family protein [Maribacter polysaccharolyticus]|uniref:FecR family protein n=1 Tax=Maribacter polysaccharolyticus TaxID=3020831 RepID=UPI00237FD325|nr:FecR family protein [Maribacter polysaccharolyticus]MDE3742772.1 FecR family protein [Maribacter polysaccharolyticus]